MSLIGQENREQFETNGYTIVENVISPESCEAIVEDMWAFMGKDPKDRESWYEPPKGLEEHFQSVGAMEMYFAQSLWDTRQDPTLYQAFAEILDEEALWTSIDRVNFTPPSDPDHPEIDSALGLHWDLDASTIPDRTLQPGGTERVPYGVQGVLHLRDTDERQGGFRCVPEAYRELDAFIAEQSGDWQQQRGDLELGDREVVDVGAGQGDLLIWDSLLLHANGRNTTEEPRFAQYVTMSPARFDDANARRARTETWRKREPIATTGDGDPRELEKDQYPPANLTPLGRKLLGLDPWPGWIET